MMTTRDVKISEGEVVHNFVARWNSMVERLEKQSCTIAKYREGNQRLRNELDARESDLTRIRVELSKAQSRHRQDIQAIDKVLQRCAERYDWCSTFNDEIEDINEVLTYPLSPRERVYIVEVPYLVTINGSRKSESKPPTRTLRVKRHSLPSTWMLSKLQRPTPSTRTLRQKEAETVGV